MTADDRTVSLPPVQFPAPPPRHRLRRVAMAWLWILVYGALATCTGFLLLLDWALYRVA